LRRMTSNCSGAAFEIGGEQAAPRGANHQGNSMKKRKMDALGKAEAGARAGTGRKDGLGVRKHNDTRGPNVRGGKGLNTNRPIKRPGEWGRLRIEASPSKKGQKRRAEVLQKLLSGVRWGRRANLWTSRVPQPLKPIIGKR